MSFIKVLSFSVILAFCWYSSGLLVLLKKLNRDARDFPAGTRWRLKESTSVYEVLSVGLSSRDEEEFLFSPPKAWPDFPSLKPRLDFERFVKAKKDKRNKLNSMAPTVIQSVDMALEPMVVLFPALLKSFLPITYAAVRMAALVATNRNARM